MKAMEGEEEDEAERRRWTEKGGGLPVARLRWGEKPWDLPASARDQSSSPWAPNTTG